MREERRGFVEKRGVTMKGCWWGRRGWKESSGGGDGGGGGGGGGGNAGGGDAGECRGGVINYHATPSQQQQPA